MKITTLAIRRAQRVSYVGGMADDSKEPTELPKLYIRERMALASPKLTAKVLAERMETSEAQVSRLLNGQRKMSLEWLFAFSKALDTPIDQIFSPPNARNLPEITSDPEILAFLARIKGFTKSDIDAVFGVIMLALRAKQAGSQSDEDRGQPAPSNPRHESTPLSRKAPQTDA